MKVSWILSIAVLFAAPVRASEPDERTPLQKLTDESVHWYDLWTGPESATPAKPVPVLRWDNNARGSSSGLTVLYIADGRPEAVVCIYPWEGRLTHEFGSLSRGTFIAKRDGETIWTPQTPGVSFAPVPDADPPADKPVVRQRQIKALARRFEATLVGWRRDNSDRQELRLLPRPIYEYDSKNSDNVDGAVFAFVMGTDPEVLLMIEAVKVGDKQQWQYAFARRTSGELEGRLDGKAVWTAERYPGTMNPTGTGFNVRGPRIDDLTGSNP
ncbi:MAG: hypothetical protein ACREJB_15855 [Planctomycetaceae bacterium]